MPLIQLSLLPQMDESLNRYYKFDKEAESHLDNFKYLHKQLCFCDADETVRTKSADYLHKAQFEIAKMLVILGKEYEGKRFEKDFNWFYDVFIHDRIGGYISSPLSQATMYEYIHNARMRFSSFLARFSNIIKPFCENNVKYIDEYLKLSQYYIQEVYGSRK